MVLIWVLVLGVGLATLWWSLGQLGLREQLLEKKS